MFYSNKYKWLAINSSFIFVSYLQRKKLQERLRLAEENSNPEKKPKNVFFSNMNPDQFKSKLKHEEILLNYKKRISEYRQAAIFEDLSDLFEFTNQKIADQNKPPNDQDQTAKKVYLEEAVYAGDENDVPNRGFIQINIGKRRRMMADKHGKDPLEAKSEDDILLEDPFNYFQKLLLFRIGDIYYATGSFCSYDLIDLKEGILLGDKLVCPNCLSEYNVSDGNVESGPACKNLASFPVSLRNSKIFVRVPTVKLPVFANPIIAEYNNELDPRHVVLIGDTETVVSALHTMRLFFTGKISIITNKSDQHFIDMNKLTKSMFPLRAKHAKFFDNQELNKMGINVYDEKVQSIDCEKRVITLKNKMKIPFDKVLIAVGSHREKLSKNYENLFTLQNIRDHANIHNAIVKENVKSIALIGDNMKTLEIASSIRRYMDALGREDVNICIISDKPNVIEAKCGLNAMKIIQDYLKRNRIFIFRGNELELEEHRDSGELDDKMLEISDGELSEATTQAEPQLQKGYSINQQNTPRISNILVKGEKYVFKLPVDVVIYENGLQHSKCDFTQRILVTQDLNKRIAMDFPNIFLPDERLSLNEVVRYPTIFAAGNCALIDAPALYHSKLRSDNMRVNYQQGFFATISMFEYHYPFDDVVVDNCKILDKNLFYIGMEPMIDEKEANVPVTTVEYINNDKQQFVIYKYSDDNKLIGCFLFGFKNLHMFIREAIRYKLIPSLNYAEKNKNVLHRHITEEYTEDLMKRGLMAYNDLTKKYREEDLKQQEEFEKIKQAEVSAMKNKNKVPNSSSGQS